MRMLALQRQTGFNRIKVKCKYKYSGDVLEFVKSFNRIKVKCKF